MSTAAVRSFVAALLPPRLPAPRDAVADAGWSVDSPGSYCNRCGASVGPSVNTQTGCPFCVDRDLLWARVYRLGAYRPPMRDWVLQMKFARHWAWAEWFGRQLADQLADSAPRVVVPVPLHWRRRWQRGFDQAQVMAAALAARRGWPCARVLRRVRPTAEQASLATQTARRDNVAGAFERKRVDLSGTEVLLVDDVATTGATAEQAARLLRRGGAGCVDLAVAAVADRRGADFTAT